MKRTIMAAMVLSLAAGSLAFAAPQDHDRDHHEDRHQMVEHEHGMRDEHGMHDEHEHGMHDEHEHGMHDEHEHGRFMMSDRYVRPHGYHWHAWRRGDRLPRAYRSSAYVIPDPVIYRLRPPPAGYYWVRVDNNAVLAAVATGAVIDVAVNLFH